MESLPDINFKQVCLNSETGFSGDYIIYMASNNLKAYVITYSADRHQILLCFCFHWVNRIFPSFFVLALLLRRQNTSELSC